MRSAAKTPKMPAKAGGLLARLRAGGNRTAKMTFSKAEVTQILRNLATLTSNGVPLPKAIGALADEKSLSKHREALERLRKRLESGDTFSHALSVLSGDFDRVMIAQIRVGERAGALPDTLLQIADQREKAGKIKENVVKKLAYPVVLAGVGGAVVAFLLCYVVPVFEETYSSANVPLPEITRLMIRFGALAQGYWWVPPGAAVLIAFTIKRLRQQDALAEKMDAELLRLPLVGPWLRDAALLQLMETLGSLMEAGFTLAEALEEAGDSVGNRSMKAGVADLHRAVQQGERFSREVERHSNLFPPMVSQLVIVGERTGRLTKSTRQIRGLLEEEIARKTDVAIGVIEPTLTISMAGAVAVILLAIYLPMFDMINTVG